MQDCHTSQQALTPRKPGGNAGLKQAYDLRDFTNEEALRLRDAPLADKETPSARAQAITALVRAWDVASERIRIIRNRPLPGSLKPEASKGKAKRKPAVPIAPAS